MEYAAMELHEIKQSFNDWVQVRKEAEGDDWWPSRKKDGKTVMGPAKGSMKVSPRVIHAHVILKASHLWTTPPSDREDDCA